MFEGIKGSSGAIALDDIEYTVGIDCAGEVKDPLSSKMCQLFYTFFNFLTATIKCTKLVYQLFFFIENMF